MKKLKNISNIETEIDWKIYFDDKHKKPIGYNNVPGACIVSGLDEELPSILKDDNISIRKAKLIIYKDKLLK